MKIKNIILTGSEGLIGKSYRSYAEKKGYNLFCIDKKIIQRKNYFCCDITDEKQVSKTISSIFKKKQISLLINNAATNPTLNPPTPDWRVQADKLGAKGWEGTITYNGGGTYSIG